MQERGKYLGVDYGTKRVGVALSDDEGRIAFAHSILRNNRALVSAVASIIRQKGITGVVVGSSHNFAGEPNEIMVDIEAFALRVKEAVQLPVIFEPEFLTSVEARRTATDKNRVDAHAAALILQRFLDRQRPNELPLR